jgi:hypothetical protein
MIAAGILLSSCDFLDVVPEKEGTLEYAFGERERAIRYLAACYSFLPRIENEGASPGRTVGTEAYQYQASENNGNKITRLGNNIVSPYMNYWDGGGGVTRSTTTDNGVSVTISKDIFTALRYCNTFIDNVDQIPDLPSYEKASWKAEVKFLKAYYHWWLLQLYGPIPVIRENLSVDAPPEAVQVAREPLDDVMEYIVQLLDESIESLNDVVDTDVSDLGRITKPIAMAMKAKILTYYASPFYNGNTGYAGFTNREGKRFFPEADPSKWNKALDACRQAIQYCEQLGYTLYTFEKPIGKYMSDSTKYVLTPSSVVTVKWHRELIWGLSTTDYTTVQQNAVPQLTTAFRSAGSVRSRFSPTLASVETFYSANGVPIEEDTDWRDNNWYNERYTPVTSDGDHHYVIENGYTTARLHLNREYRFYGSLAFDGGLWYGAVSNPDENSQITVKARAGEAAGKQGIERYSITGYWPKKLVSTRTLIKGTATSLTADPYAWPAMRLADLYLLYAEARNETLPAPDDSVFLYINRVRERAGLQTVQASWTKSVRPDKYTTKAGMRDIIHQERLIELAYEGHYYFDVRRWSGGLERAKFDIMTEMNNPVKGWNIEGATVEDFYIVRNIFAPKFSFRDYLWPIKESTMTSNGNLIQNPGW